MQGYRMKVWVCVLLWTIVAVGADARTAVAQSLCYPITPGDTAARIAERLTGNPASRHATWFQIVDQRSRVVSKFDYDVIRPGWLACLSQTRVATAERGGQAPRAGLEPVPLPAALQESIDFTFLAVAGFLAGAVLLLRCATQSARCRRERGREMRKFGARFVQEFGRPMTQFRGATPPPHARLRVSPRRSRVEVLLAPANGDGYPNLADHRSNVDYDVARVMAVVGRESFVNGSPYAEGRWVVLPFHFKGPVKREGVR